jgi:hypothetical protein
MTVKSLDRILILVQRIIVQEKKLLMMAVVIITSANLKVKLNKKHQFQAQFKM